MKVFIQRKPILFGLLTSTLIMLIFILSGIFITIQEYQKEIDIIYRFLFSLPMLYCIKQLYGYKNYKEIFSWKGTRKGLLASQGIILISLLCILPEFWGKIFNKAFMNTTFLMIMQQIGTGLFEEGVFRGLLMGGMLQKWSHSIRGKIGMVLISGISFGLLHFMNFFSGSPLNSVLYNMLFASIFGIVFASSYLYSKNLLITMIIHAVYDIITHSKGQLFLIGISDSHFWDLYSKVYNFILYIYIPLIALFFTIKAKPWGTNANISIETNHENLLDSI